MAASKKFLNTFPRDGFTVLELGDMEIWDGADMALLREMLVRVIKGSKCRRVGVDMAHVKYIPSGFFGMLFDWYEAGVRIRLFDPQPNVRRMLWFSRFFEEIETGCHELQPKAVADFPSGYPLTAPPAKKVAEFAENPKAVVRAGR